MGFQNRPYLKRQDDDGTVGEGGSGMAQLGLSRPTPAVLGIMIACAAMFILTAVVGDRIIYGTLALSLPASLQIWRFVTFQFLHASPGHIIFNMLGLYFFGPPLERMWGTKRFLAFYLTCGVFAGVCFDVLAAAENLSEPLVGASGGILGLLTGCAILMPSMLVFFLPIRIATVLFGVLYVLSILTGQNKGDAAHLGGMVMAGLWIWGQSRLRIGRIGGQPSRLAGMLKNGSWERKLQARRKAQAEVDRILKKIHDEGIASLTRKERNILQDASRRQQDEDRRIGRL